MRVFFISFLFFQDFVARTARRTSTTARATSARTGPPASTASTATRVSARRRLLAVSASRTWTSARWSRRCVKTALPAPTAWAPTPAYASTGGQGRTVQSTSTIAKGPPASTGLRASTGSAAFTASARREKLVGLVVSAKNNVKMGFSSKRFLQDTVILGHHLPAPNWSTKV